MMRHLHIKILIALSILLLSIYSHSSAQEKIEAREEARQHYLQGREFYSQGRYQEATTEFQKAMTIITPSEVEFMEKTQKEQVLSGLSGQGKVAESIKATPIEIPSEVQFMEKVQKEEEKTLAPAPPKKLTTTHKEKLQRKKKEEKKEEEEEETETTKPLVLEKEPEPEIQAQEREYYIDLGDVLDISVWQVPDLSRADIIVRPDGKISLPLIGDIKVEGLTLTQLDDVVTEKLKAYVKYPEVSVMIRRFGEQANKIIILGEVPGPGVYKFSGPPSIVEAIASAGGYTKYAVLNSIMIIRGDVTRVKPDVTRINLVHIIKGGRVSENIFLKPNDIVYVPRSFIGNINTFLELIQPAISEYMQTMNARHFQHILHRN